MPGEPVDRLVLGNHMKTAIQFQIASICLTLVLTTISFGQSDRGVSPVYIPDDSGNSKTAKAVEKIKSISFSKSEIKTAEAVSDSDSGVVALASAASPCDGCDSGGDCGCSGACDSGCGCDSGGCSSGCCDANCGCGGCDRIGRSFFGRVRNRLPISFSVNRGGGSNGCGCDDSGCNASGCKGGCNGCRGNQSLLSRLLPVSINIESNHCCKYVSIFGGYVDLEDYRGDAGGGMDRLIDFNGGWQMGIKRGRIFANGIRIENELTYRHNTAGTYYTGNFVGPMNFVPTSSVDATDSISGYSSMNNVLYDFKRQGRRTTPYVGFGVGGSYVQGEILTPGRVDYIDDTALSYQLILGASRQINKKTFAFAEYKYFGTSGVEFENNVGMPATPGDFGYQSNNLIFGLRFIRPR